MEITHVHRSSDSKGFHSPTAAVQSLVSSDRPEEFDLDFERLMDEELGALLGLEQNPGDHDELATAPTNLPALEEEGRMAELYDYASTQEEDVKEAKQLLEDLAADLSELETGTNHPLDDEIEAMLDDLLAYANAVAVPESTPCAGAEPKDAGS